MIAVATGFKTVGFRSNAAAGPYKPFKKSPWGENHEHDTAWVYAEAKSLGTIKPKQEQWFNDFIERNKLIANQFQKYFVHMEANGNQAHASTTPLIKKEEFDEEFVLIPVHHIGVLGIFPSKKT